MKTRAPVWLLLAALLTTPVHAADDPAPAGEIAAASKRYVDRAGELALQALALIGIRYQWGGNDPEHGLDCSGLVSHVFHQVAGIVLPRDSRALSKVGAAVEPHELKPGDLVFFNTRRRPFSHVGIYVGGDRFVHAPRRGRAVEISELRDGYWKKRFNGARRLAL